MEKYEKTIMLHDITFIAKDDITADFMQLLLQTGTLEQIAKDLPEHARVAITAPCISCKAVDAAKSF